MSNLGGKVMSENTDADEITTGIVETVVAGTSCSVDATDPANPIVNVDAETGVVATVVGGTNCSVDATDPVNPIVNADTQNNAKVTTKGDLEGFSSVAARIPVGTDTHVLTADSGEALGLKWAAPAGGYTDPLTTKGDLVAFDTATKRLPVGTNDQVLTADSTTAEGVAWKTAAGGGSNSAGGMRRDTNLAVGGLTSGLVFQTEDYDDDSFIDIAGNPSRLTVPTGMTRANVFFNIVTTATVTLDSDFEMVIRRFNSSDVAQEDVGVYKSNAAAVTYGASVAALGVVCVATDYFELIMFFADGSVTLDFATAVIQDVT